MRNTRQKELILDIINKSCSHPNAYDVYLECRKEIPNISLGTVYRNLNTLVESNRIQKINCNDNIDRYDKMINHSHFICIKCNKIIDINEKVDYNEYVGDNKVLNCKVILEGLCRECLEEER
ncbi:MAG: transcriptional repressor [Bacilli bacterium]|nr:transcriptional repressor [Bacilli bacterium]